TLQIICRYFTVVIKHLRPFPTRRSSDLPTHPLDVLGRDRPRLPARRLLLVVRDDGLRDRRPGGALCALLPVLVGPGLALLRVLPRLHGLDGRRGPLRKPDPAGLLLGADVHRLVPADRLLVP